MCQFSFGFVVGDGDAIPRERGEGGKRGKVTAHEVNPRADAHLLALLHHLEGLVKEYFAGEGVVYDFDVAVGEGEAPPRGVFFHADAATEGQLEDDAASQGVGDVVVPERQIALRANRRLAS